MVTLRKLKQQIESDPENWVVHLMDFVDDFRFHKDPSAVAQSFDLSNDKLDAVIASLGEYLCDELRIACPEWLTKVPACKTPWFPSGIESLKAIAIVESPLHFRIRKIFVLDNFLSRV